jgi:SET domain-containing protein
VVHRRRFVVRRSSIHGRGVFARLPIAAGDLILEYRGAIVTWEQATAEQHANAVDDGHTLLFDIGDGLVIDGSRGGNSGRWINHGCEPNCEAVVVGRRIEIYALRDLEPGEELLLDYQLQLEVHPDEADTSVYACRCGAPSCRTSMLPV